MKIKYNNLKRRLATKEICNVTNDNKDLQNIYLIMYAKFINTPNALNYLLFQAIYRINL